MSGIGKPTIIRPEPVSPQNESQVMAEGGQPRRRGRPRKNEIVAVHAVPRKRGRPRKPVDPNAPVPVPKRRGRPRKPDAKYPTVADMKSFRRKWAMIDMMLHSREGYTVDEMAEHFKVTTRTIRRDLKILDDIFNGLEVRRVRWGLKRYYLEQLPFGPKGKNVNRDELISICIARQLMLPLEGTSLGEAMKSGCEKIRNCLSKESVEYADKVVSFFQQFDTQSSLKKNGKFFDVFLKAMVEGRALMIRYFSARAQEEKVYEVLPYNFIFDKGFVYLAGYSCADKENRLWKFNRIKAIKQSETQFLLPKNFNIEKFASAAVKPYLGKGEPRRVRVRFSPKAAFDVEEQCYAVTKKKRTRDDGVLEVEMEVDPNPSFINWILSFGMDAEVVSPVDVRRLFYDEAEKLAELYQ